jgi:hypothetical protein
MIGWATERNARPPSKRPTLRHGLNILVCYQIVEFVLIDSRAH